MAKDPGTPVRITVLTNDHDHTVGQGVSGPLQARGDSCLPPERMRLEYQIMMNRIELCPRPAVVAGLAELLGLTGPGRGM